MLGTMESPHQEPVEITSPVKMDASRGRRFLRASVEWAAIAVAGIAGFVLPVLIWPPAQLFPSPLFPHLRTAIETTRLESFIALGVVGFLAGLFCRLRCIWIGLACVTLFPLAAFAEIAKDPTSHNLIPFEIVMYGLYSLLPLLAGAAGRGIRRLAALGQRK